MIQYCCLHLSPILCTKRNETRKRTQLKIKRSALITKAAPRDILDSCMRRRFQRAFRQAQRRVGKEKGHTYPVFSPESFLQIITIDLRRTAYFFSPALSARVLGQERVHALRRNYRNCLPGSDEESGMPDAQPLHCASDEKIAQCIARTPRKFGPRRDLCFPCTFAENERAESFLVPLRTWNK